MIKHIIKRILGLIPTLIGITLISFFVIHLAPGKPTDVETSMNPKVSYEARERLEKLYGLDKPVYVQYFNWLRRVAVSLACSSSCLWASSRERNTRIALFLFLSCDRSSAQRTMRPLGL